MAKWADFLISGVWKDSSQRITDVMLHEDTENNFLEGKKTSEAAVIQLLKNKKTVITITWNYPEWHKGANVEYTERNGIEFLKTDPNATIKDNLDNSIRILL